MRPIAVLLLSWWFVMHATSSVGNGSQPLDHRQRRILLPGFEPREIAARLIPARSASAIWLSPRTARSRRSPRANRSLGAAQ